MGSCIHDFYCIACGKSVPAPRKKGKKHEKFHRKKMWCPYCKQEINHVECKNEIEAEKFKEDFANGVYVDEIEESLAHVRDTSIWKKQLYSLA